MASSPSALYLVAMVQLALVGLLLAGQVLVQRVRGSRLRRWSTALGVILIVLVGSFEARRIVRAQGTRVRTGPIHAVIHRGDPTRAAQLQMLVAVRLDSSSCDSDEVYEVLAPIPTDVTARVKAAIPELGVIASFTLEPADLFYDITATGRLSSTRPRMTNDNGRVRLGRFSIDVGDGVPFNVIQIDTRRIRPMLALLRPGSDFVAVLVRVLRADDVLELIPGSAMHEHIAAVFSKEDGSARRGALAELMKSAHGIGLLMMLAGVVLVCATRMSMIQSLVVSIFVCLLTISGAARIDLARQMRGLDDLDPAMRARAVVRLARSPLFRAVRRRHSCSTTSTRSTSTCARTSSSPPPQQGFSNA